MSARTIRVTRPTRTRETRWKNVPSIPAIGSTDTSVPAIFLSAVSSALWTARFRPVSLS
jgi:hypothetical protein